MKVPNNPEYECSTIDWREGRRREGGGRMEGRGEREEGRRREDGGERGRREGGETGRREEGRGEVK